MFIPIGGRQAVMVAFCDHHPGSMSRLHCTVCATNSHLPLILENGAESFFSFSLSSFIKMAFFICIVSKLGHNQTALFAFSKISFCNLYHSRCQQLSFSQNFSACPTYEPSTSPDIRTNTTPYGSLPKGVSGNEKVTGRKLHKPRKLVVDLTSLQTNPGHS